MPPSSHGPAERQNPCKHHTTTVKSQAQHQAISSRKSTVPFPEKNRATWKRPPTGVVYVTRQDLLLFLPLLLYYPQKGPRAGPQPSEKVFNYKPTRSRDTQIANLLTVKTRARTIRPPPRVRHTTRPGRPPREPNIKAPQKN